MFHKKPKKQKHSSALDEFVFEGRNKSYGAYPNRVNYFTRAKYGFYFSIAFTIILLNLPGIIKDIFKTHRNAIEISVPANTSASRLSDIPPPQEEKKPDAVQPGKIAGGLFNTRKSHRDSIAEHLLKDTLDVMKDTLAMDTSMPERLPMFPGGNKLLAEYIHLHLIYPDLDRKAGIHGVQYVYFTVNEDGSLDDIEALDELSIPIGHAAEDLIQGMPKWWPAKHLNKRVKTQVKIPVRFTLE